MLSKDPGIHDNIPTFVFIGKTGVGKSTLCNSFLGSLDQSLFNVSPEINSCTVETRHFNGTLLGDGTSYKVKIVDTPGLLDTSNRDSDFIVNMINVLKQEVKVVSKFMFVLNGTDVRWDSPTTMLLRIFHKEFGDDFFDHMAICYTRWGSDKKATESRKRSNLTEEMRINEITCKLQEEFPQVSITKLVDGKVKSKIPVYFTDTDDIIFQSPDKPKELWHTDKTSSVITEAYTMARLHDYFDCDNLIVCRDWEQRYTDLKIIYDENILKVDDEYKTLLNDLKFKQFLEMTNSQKRRLKEDQWADFEKQFNDYFVFVKQNQDLQKDLLGEEKVDVVDFEVEIGTIASYISKYPPNGWLACDGKAYSTEDYPELYDKINIQFGGEQQDQGKWTFNVPDCRGRTLRCIDLGSGIDKDNQSRKNWQGATVGDQVGSLQDFATNLSRNNLTTSTEGLHSHTWTPAICTAPNGIDKNNLRWGLDAGTDNRNIPTSEAGDHTHNIYFTDSSETRPVNISMLFMIKSKPSKMKEKFDKCLNEVASLRKIKQVQDMKESIIQELDKMEKEKKGKVVTQEEINASLQKQNYSLQKQVEQLSKAFEKLQK